MLGQYRRRSLANGLRVLGVENPALHSFVCSVYVHVGPRFETHEETGLSHFLEHMIVQGSENFPNSNAIMRGIEDVGGVVDAGTYPEYLNVVFGAHRKHWRRVMEIASDVLLNPLFDPQEVEQEKLIIAQEISRYRDRKGLNISAAEIAHCVVYRGRVYESGTRGTPQMMEQFDRETVLAHYRRFFRPGNMVVCLAGGFEFDEVADAVAAAFDGMEPSEGPPEAPLPPAGYRSGRSRSFYRQTEALPVADILMSHNAYAITDQRFDAARAANHALGAGLSSRLFTRVREELGLVYDVRSHLQGYSDSGTIDVSLSVGVENLNAALEATLQVLRETTEDGFCPEELERYKEGARCGMEMLCDRATRLADWFGRQELLQEPGRVLTPEQYVERQEDLTLEALGAVMREITAEHGVVLAVVGPFGDEEQQGLEELFPANLMEPVPAGASNGKQGVERQ